MADLTEILLVDLLHLCDLFAHIAFDHADEVLELDHLLVGLQQAEHILLSLDFYVSEFVA
jgi:hypothetical protein